MRRKNNELLLGFLLISVYCAHALETQVPDDERAPHSHVVIHHPTASLSIAGDLNDVKLKSSIAHLVRALQTPSQSQIQAEKKPIIPEELITKQNVNVHSSYARKLYSGPEVPQPITISSQAIRINSNKTGGKRSRSMSSVDADGVRTIEGIRVPDDEHDKHYTWRNARVIKGFLVPNDKSPNPHKKRQVVINTDPNAYLAAAVAAQAQGATSIIDTAAQNARQAVYATQPDATKSAYYNYNAQPQYQQLSSSQSQQPVQQPHQYQYQMPSAATQSGQTTAFTYAQQQGQMLVMQDANGNSYVQYSPVQSVQPQPVSQVSHSQNQFSSRSGEPSASTSSQSQPQQTVTSQISRENPQQLQQQIAQAQAAVQAIQQLQQSQGQSQAQVQVHSVQVQDPSVHSVQQSGQSDQVQGQIAQDILAAAASGAQYIVQTPAQPGSASYQVSAQNTFSERNGQVVQGSVGQTNQASQNGFVIQPQTYVAGPGGQTFTIPIPVPSEQAQQSQQRHNWQAHHQTQAQTHHRLQNNRPNHLNGKTQNTFADRVMDALHTNKKVLERMDTSTAVVPALASTGIFLGLSALAAGWYLSKGNREVGIVRRTGKPRNRRDVALPVNNYPQEVDQATFFQSIIQQSLEKTQQQYEDQAVEPQPAYNHQEPVYTREPEPERQQQRPNKHYRVNRPQNRDDSGNDDFSNHKSSKNHYAQEKSGLTVGSSKNFAKVFIPALILGLSVISITALIFGWYITGANREIAFLEPASYSRKKRSLLGSTALSDGWLQRTITAIHANPYDRMPAPTSKSLLPHPFMDRETSKTSDLEFKISNSGLTGVLAGGALIAIVALGWANSLSEGTSRQLKTGRANPSSFPNPHVKHLRAPRSVNDGSNDLSQPDANNPGYLATILSSIEQAESNFMTKLKNSGLLDTQSPCSKRLICEILLSEDDDTIRTTEKHMSNFFNLLPTSMSSSLKQNFGDILTAVHKRSCSSFVCGYHGVGSVKSSPASVSSR